MFRRIVRDSRLATGRLPFADWRYGAPAPGARATRGPGTGRSHAADLRAAVVRRLAEVWPAGARFPEGPLHAVPRGTPGGLQRQAPRLLPELRGAAHGGDRGAAGGRGPAPSSPSAHLIRRAGLKQSAAQAGAVTLIQRFGSALNLNIHFHLLVLDGVYIRNNDRLEFRRMPPPTKTDGPRGNWRPGRGRRRGGRLRGNWGLRKGVGRSGPGRVHDAGGSRLRGWRPAGPKAVAAGVPGWQTSAMRVAVFEFPIPQRVLETVSLTADSKSGPY